MLIVNVQDEDKVVIKWLTILMGGLVVIAIALLIFSMMIASAVASVSPFDAIAERLRPVGQVVVATPPRDENDESVEESAAQEPADEDSVNDVEPAPEEAAVVEDEPAETAVVEDEPPATTEAEETSVAVNGVQIPAGLDAAAGQSIYASACLVCHAQGIAGAPILGDASTWGDRLAKGWDTLAHNSLNGIGAMPPKGGRMDLSDEDILNATAYMIEQIR